MNNDKKIVLGSTIALVTMLIGTVTTITIVSSKNPTLGTKRKVDIELEQEAEKINKSENIYYNYSDKAPVSEKVVEENAMQEITDETQNTTNNQTNEEKNNVVTEIVKRELKFSTPLAKDTYEIVDTFSDKYLGFTQTYIETIIFKINFKSGNPGIIYKVNKDDTQVYAMEDGKVISVGDNTGKNAGYSIIIEHENGIKTEYYCLKKVQVKEGAMVKKGDKIALVGNIGSTLLKNELRIYMLLDDKIVNPETYLK